MGNQQTLGCSSSNAATSRPLAVPIRGSSSRSDTATVSFIDSPISTFYCKVVLKKIVPNTLSSYSTLSIINDTNVKQAGGVVPPSTQAAKKKPKALREKNRFGTVIVKVASLSSNRRVQERQNIFSITPRGALFHGTQCNPALVQKGMHESMKQISLE